MRANKWAALMADITPLLAESETVLPKSRDAVRHLIGIVGRVVPCQRTTESQGIFEKKEYRFSVSIARLFRNSKGSCMITLAGISGYGLG